ncbi:hypothetical protein BT63DRAFT_468213 [Microthyrium microscopicum]|uniref:VPS9 domain-containing protein n=1 Tax=Microthyrium microscopicum TaxID=703497 RepID=A0A6A6UMU3_9PEZI|nr:hypothetical protein BT63DRAFT_468213 [Microthyrium microscopicum]
MNTAKSSKEASPPPPPLPPKDERFAIASDSKPSKSPNLDPEKEAYKLADADQDASDITEKARSNGGDDDSRSEIQSIMDQFAEGGPGADEIMSPRMVIAGPMLGSPLLPHPPRKSSLEPLQSGSQTSLLPSDNAAHSPSSSQQLPPRSSSLISSSPTGLGIESIPKDSTPTPTPSSPVSTRHLAPAPPQPDPDSDQPFDFHRFLEQLRHRSADPVARFLRSFLQEFSKKQWMVHEQVKIVSDFLDFISKKMAQCEIWRTVSDAEFDNACEGMEKLVMNRLYSQTFSPEISPPDPIASRGKRRTGGAPPPGRRGQHQEDIERDEVLAQKVRIYSWVREEHLDIKSVSDKGRKFLSLAQQELLKIGNYRAPRDKVICVLNCCKVIFGFLKNAQHDQSADSFVPLLIYTVLRANPPNLVSNVQYILRFRNANKLTGEAGYYVSSLGGAIDFIERLDRTSLTISDADFEKNVEASVSAIAERHAAEEPKPPVPPRPQPSDGPPPLPRRNGRPASDDGEDENAAVAGLLRTIQRPLSTIGRIFSDEGAPPAQPPPQQQSHMPPTTPQPPPRLSPALRGAVSADSPAGQRTGQGNAEDMAARQASKEAEEARRLRVREEGHVVETLCGMFPDLDREVVVDVVRANEGRRIGSAVDACLALST